MRLANEVLLLKTKKKGGTIIDTKNLTQLEIDNIIDESINLSIISKLLNLKLIDEKQFYILKGCVLVCWGYLSVLYQIR